MEGGSPDARKGLANAFCAVMYCTAQWEYNVETSSGRQYSVLAERMRARVEGSSKKKIDYEVIHLVAVRFRQLYLTMRIFVRKAAVRQGEL